MSSLGLGLLPRRSQATIQGGPLQSCSPDSLLTDGRVSLDLTLTRHLLPFLIWPRATFHSENLECDFPFQGLLTLFPFSEIPLALQSSMPLWALVPILNCLTSESSLCCRACLSGLILPSNAWGSLIGSLHSGVEQLKVSRTQEPMLALVQFRD